MKKKGQSKGLRGSAPDKLNAFDSRRSGSYMFVRGRSRSGRDERASQRRSAGSFRAWFVVLFVVPDRVFVISVYGGGRIRAKSTRHGGRAVLSFICRAAAFSRRRATKNRPGDVPPSRARCSFLCWRCTAASQSVVSQPVVFSAG